jgi:hypothetical protein
MGTFQESMNEYRKQLEKGPIKEAYQGLMKYFMDLRTYFKNTYPDDYVSSLYQGHMDMTFFSFYSPSLKKRGLKIGIIFVHDVFRFEVWLVGFNKQIQNKYWKIFKERNWDQYQIVPTTKGVDSIVEHILVDNPDFSDLGILTKQIEKGTMKFIQDVESFLSTLKN